MHRIICEKGMVSLAGRYSLHIHEVSETTFEEQLGTFPFLITKNKRTMKKCVIALLAAMCLTACEKSNEVCESNGTNETDVVLTFSPYEMAAMTRAATSIAGIVTHLDVWITDGTTTTDLHQTSGDAGFGSLSVTLDKTKTYTLYAVGHRADGATLADGVISFTDDKVTHSMFYTTTFSPATTTELSCLMQRIVADFRLEITDDIPAACKSFRFTVNGIFDRWNVSTGGTHELDRVSTISYGGTSSIFNVYAIVTDASTTHDITVTALDENDQEVQTRTFLAVPLRNGYKTSYRGTFFIDTPVTSGFTVNEWNEYDVVDF